MLCSQPLFHHPRKRKGFFLYETLNVIVKWQIRPLFQKKNLKKFNLNDIEREGLIEIDPMTKHGIVSRPTSKPLGIRSVISVSIS